MTSQTETKDQPMKSKPFSLRIRIGAAHDSVTFNGHTFDRSRMTRDEKRNLRLSVVRGFQQATQPKRKEQRA
jgi:hypothetical protein